MTALSATEMEAFIALSDLTNLGPTLRQRRPARVASVGTDNAKAAPRSLLAQAACPRATEQPVVGGHPPTASSGGGPNHLLRAMKVAFMAAHFPNAPSTKALPSGTLLRCTVVDDVAGIMQPVTARRQALAGELQDAWDAKERAMAQRRMQALKDSNAEEYLQHLSALKMSSLLAVMEKTHRFMIDIGARLQQHATGSGGHSTDPHAIADPDESDEARFRRYVSSTKDEYKLVHQVETVIDAQPEALEATLMPHQMVGLRFLASLHANNINGILADEMGVGKTLQTLAFLTLLKERGKARGPHLVLAPLSIVREWLESAATFLPSLTVARFDELEDQIRGPMTCDVVLLAIHRVRAFVATLQRTKWDFIVVDEAHKAVANPTTQTATAITSLPFYSRLVLTGTPLNNDIQELWALLNFINPRVFGSQDSFDDVFRKPFGDVASAADITLEDEEREVLVLRLHQILRPFMLRRTKRDIDTNLRITFHNVTCPLSALQRQLITQLRGTGTLPAFLGDHIGVRHVTTREALAQTICNHPFQLPFFAQCAARDARGNSRSSSTSTTTQGGSNAASDDDSSTQQSADLCDAILGDAAIATSGKFLVLFTLLRRLRSIGRKAVIFSHFLDTIGLLADTLESTELAGQSVVLTGATSGDERKEFVHRFRNEPTLLFFVLSVKAGGCGLNLQVADVVILLDRDYTTTNEDQAIARVFRMGQQNTVRAMYLSTDDPSEARITELAEAKDKPRLALIEAGAYKADDAAADDEDAQRAALQQTLQTDVEQIDLRWLLPTHHDGNSPAEQAGTALLSADGGEALDTVDGGAGSPQSAKNHQKSTTDSLHHFDKLLCGECDDRLASLAANDTDTFPSLQVDDTGLPPAVVRGLAESARTVADEAAGESRAGRGQRQTAESVWIDEVPDWFVEKWAEAGLDEFEIEEKYKTEKLARTAKREAKAAERCSVSGWGTTETTMVSFRTGQQAPGRAKAMMMQLTSSPQDPAP